MSSGGHSRAGWIGVVGAAAAVLTTTAAFAGGGSTATNTVETTAVRGKTKAVCDGERRAVAGGFRTELIKGDHAYVKSLRRAGRRGWLAGIDSSFSGGELTAYAYCRPKGNPLAKLETKSRKVTIPVDVFKLINARCARGQTPVSGGFSSPFDDYTYPTTSKRKGARKWQAGFIANQAESPDVTVQANCYDGPPLEARSNTETLDPPPAYTLYEVSATCPPGSKVISGGFKSSSPITKSGPFVHESRKTGPREWTIGVTLGYFPIEFTTYAYCR